MSNVDDFFQEIESGQCESVRARQQKVLDLLEIQTKTVQDVVDTRYRVDEKTTRLVQQDVKKLCELFDDLVGTSQTARALRAIGHPAMANLDVTLQNIKEICGVCRLPLAEGLTESEYLMTRFNCLMVEEVVTNTAHQNFTLENILIDREMEGHHRTIASKFRGFTPIHDYYEALLRKDTMAANRLVSVNRKILSEAVC